METLIFKTLLYVSLLIVTLLFITKRNTLSNNTTKIEKTVFYILLIVQIVRHITYIAMGRFTWLIPLHVCNISAIIVIIWLLTRSEKIKGFMYLFSFLAIAALVYPAVDYSWKNPLYYTFIIDHIILLFVPFYMTKVYRYRPNKKEFISTVVILISLLLIGHFLNAPLNENYFYLEDKPLFPEMNTWLYMLLYVGVVLFCFTLIQYLSKIILKKEPI